MADSVSVTSHHSYGSRVGNSFKSILWWIVLVVISIILLVRNEKNYVEQKAALNEWASIVQETTVDQINPELEWKEVHLYGETASTDMPLKDDTFWVVVDDLKLKRTVEMYQWYEEEDTECTDNLWWSEDCTTTYTYHTAWDTEAINSNSFYKSEGHHNPTDWEYKSNEREKSPITLWAYTLTDTFINKLDNYNTINLSEQNINVPSKYKLAADQTAEASETEVAEVSETETVETSWAVTEEVSETTAVEDNNNSYLYWDSQETTTTNTTLAANEKFHINGNQIYIWSDPAEPAVWDLRITFSSVKPWTVSIVGKQVWKELASYTVSNGRNIALLEQWTVTAADMFQHAQQANKIMTWLIRLLWLVLMFSGFSAMFKFIETLAKVIPFLSKIIWVWTGIIAFWLTLSVWFVTIWIAWLAVRPVVWICCLVVAAVWIFLLVRSKKNKKENKPEIKDWTPEISESK